jgi:outer membrane immunogenic protein
MRTRVLGLLLLLVPSVAFAQDVPKNWTGGYLGLEVGAGQGSVSVTDNAADGIPPGPFNYTTLNLLTGLNAGYNVQAGVFVLGVEGKVGYMIPRGQGTVPSSNPAYHQDLTINPGVTAELSAKAGLALDQTLLYTKAGVTWFGGSAQQVTTKPGYAPTGSGALPGKVVGLGVEQMLTDTVSIKAEYDHTIYDQVTAYQTSTVADPPTPVGYKFYNWTNMGIDTISVGVNVHF